MTDATLHKTSLGNYRGANNQKNYSLTIDRAEELELLYQTTTTNYY